MYVTTLKDGEAIKLKYAGEDEPFFFYSVNLAQYISDGVRCEDGWIRYYREGRCVAVVRADSRGDKADVRVDAADEVEIRKA